MITDDKIRDENVQYNINREPAKIPAWSSGKNDKYEYLTDEEVLPPDRSRVIEQVKFTNSPLGKTLEKQTDKQVEDLKSFKLSNKRGQPKQIDSIISKN